MAIKIDLTDFKKTLDKITSEQQIQMTVESELKAAHIYFTKTIVSARNGVPDIIACVNGRFIAIELKRPGKDLSDLQRYNFDLIKRNGGQTYMINNLEDASKIVPTIRGEL